MKNKELIQERIANNILYKLLNDESKFRIHCKNNSLENVYSFYKNKALNLLNNELFRLLENDFKNNKIFYEYLSNNEYLKTKALNNIKYGYRLVNSYDKSFIDCVSRNVYFHDVTIKLLLFILLGEVLSRVQWV